MALLFATLLGARANFLENLERSLFEEIDDLSRSIEAEEAKYGRHSRTAPDEPWDEPRSYYEEREERKMSPKGATNTVDALSRFVPGCTILAGYSVDTRKCDSAKALVGITKCKSTKPGREVSETCILDDFTAQASGWKEYNQKVEKTEEMTTLIDSSVKAEGAGYGLSVSASASFMMDNAATANSVMFFVGKYGDMYKSKIQGRHLLKLQAPALNLLKTDYKLFLDTYGSHYVSEVIYGTSFIGMAKVTAKTQSSKTELKTAADLKYKDVASGGASFSAATTGKSSSLDVTIKSTYIGTTGSADASATKGQYESKEAMKELLDDYHAWDARTKGDNEAKRKQSTAMKMVYRTWLDITEVMETLQENYTGEKFKEALSAFKMALPGSTVTHMIATDVIYASLQLNNLRLYKGYRCAKRDHTIMDAIDEGIDKLTQYRAQYDMITNEEILTLQSQIANHETEKVDKFFIGRDTELTRKVSEMLKKCPPQCKIEHDTQYEGGSDDYKVIWYVNDPAECANRCGADNGCQSWTLDHDKQYCWLIAKARPGKKSRKSFSAGPKCHDPSVKLNNRPARCTSEARTIVWWYDIWWTGYKSGIGSMTHCAQLCKEHKECKVWEWHDNTHWHENHGCRLKKNAPRKEWQSGKKGSFAGHECVAKINTQHFDRRLEELEYVPEENTALESMERLAALQGPASSQQ